MVKKHPEKQIHKLMIATVYAPPNFKPNEVDKVVRVPDRGVYIYACTKSYPYHHACIVMECVALKIQCHVQFRETPQQERMDIKLSCIFISEEGEVMPKLMVRSPEKGESI